MSSRVIVTALTTTLVTTLVTASFGQGPRAASLRWQDARVAAVARLDSGQRIQVEGRDSVRLTGTFLRSSDGVLLLGGNGGERSVPIADMTGLWVRGRSVGSGALVGAFVLGAGGAVLGVAAGSCDVEGSSSAGECAVLLGVVGAATGALLWRGDRGSDPQVAPALPVTWRCLMGVLVERVVRSWIARHRNTVAGCQRYWSCSG